MPFMKMNCYICKNEQSMIMLLNNKGELCINDYYCRACKLMQDGYGNPISTVPVLLIGNDTPTPYFIAPDVGQPGGSEIHRPD